jgi:spoIIIJ-associated protein
MSESSTTDARTTDDAGTVDAGRDDAGRDDAGRDDAGRDDAGRDHPGEDDPATNGLTADGDGHAADLPASSSDEAGSGESDEGSNGAAAATRPAGRRSAATLEREGEIAADYLEELLDIADLDGDIDMDVERDRAAVSIVGGDLDHLVGKDGVVLDALQDLTRLAVLTQTGERSRLMLDVGGFRAGRRTVLSELGRTTAERVSETGEPIRLAPMTPFERKIVHDAVAGAGLRSESEGEEPQRRVVVLPA